MKKILLCTWEKEHQAPDSRGHTCAEHIKRENKVIFHAGDDNNIVNDEMYNNDNSGNNLRSSFHIISASGLLISYSLYSSFLSYTLLSNVLNYPLLFFFHWNTTLYSSFLSSTLLSTALSFSKLRHTILWTLAIFTLSWVQGAIVKAPIVSCVWPFGAERTFDEIAE